jgi:hypothetical protein
MKLGIVLYKEYSSKRELRENRRSESYYTYKLLQILGAFEKLGKATVSFVLPVCLYVYQSVRPSAWNLIFEYFSKISREN